MASAAGSLFARTYAGHTGVDPYTTAVSDVYQDCSAKASSPARACTTSTRSRRRSRAACRRTRCSRTTCSRACYARAALVTDVEVVDDYPSSVLAHARRQHRWVRGDWQILWWLLPVRADAQRARAQSAAAHRALEDSRQPAAQPGAAGALAAARRRLDGAAGPPARVDAPRRSLPLAFPSLPAPLEALRGPRTGPVLARVPAHAAATTSRTDAGARSRCSSTFLAHQAWRDGPRHRRHARAAGHHQAAPARMGNSRRSAVAQRPGALARVFCRDMAASPLLGDRALPDRRARRGRRRCRSRAADPRAVGRRAAGSRMHSAGRSPRAPARSTPRTRVSPRRRAPDLALLRRLRRRRATTGLPPDNVQVDPGAAHRAPHVADQHRHGPAATLAAHDFGFITPTSSSSASTPR